MKIGLISDVHATVAPLQDALAIFQREGIETILFAGDIAGYGRELEQTVELLDNSGCRVIMGNHDLWWLSRSDDEMSGPVADYLSNLNHVMELSLAGIDIYMVHASPPASIMDGIKLLDEDAVMRQDQKDLWTDSLRDFPFDVLVVGHTHQVFAEQLGDVLVVNPGSTLFNHTCAILSLPGMGVEILPLEGKDPLLSWNWGMRY